MLTIKVVRNGLSRFYKTRLSLVEVLKRLANLPIEFQWMRIGSELDAYLWRDTDPQGPAIVHPTQGVTIFASENVDESTVVVHLRTGNEIYKLGEL